MRESKMMDVMFYEAFKEEEEILRRYLPKSIHARFTWKTIQECADKTPRAELICIRTQSKIPLGWSKHIKGILTRSQGYDHLSAYRKEIRTKIAYGYLGSYCSRAVAEQAILSMFALLRKLKKQIKNFDSFSRDGLTGLECRGRRAFIVGVGNCGGQIVDMARGLRMNVKGHDIDKKVKGLSYVSLSEGLAWADIVFCALPLTKKTEGMLDYKMFKKAKPGIIFVNISRGEISPLKDLKKLIDENILGGLSLDVYPNESALANSMRAGISNKTLDLKTIRVLSKKDQVLFTPHNAFNTQEALDHKARISAEAIIHFLNKGTFPFLVPRS